MLKLFCAEYRYYKNLYIFEYCLYLGLFICLMLDESNNYADVLSFMVGSTIVFFIMIPISLIPIVVEKRERFYTLLPVSIKTIGKLNLLFLILDIASIFILWIIFYLTKYTQLDPGLIWTMISFLMQIYIIFCLIAIGGEFGYYFNKSRNTVFLLSIVCSISFFIFTINTIKYTYSMMNIESPLLKAYLNLVKSPSGALIMSLLAGLMIFLFYRLYINRRYYRAIS